MGSTPRPNRGSARRTCRCRFRAGLKRRWGRIGNGEIAPAVAVEIAGGEAGGSASRRVIDRGGKRAVPVAEERRKRSRSGWKRRSGFAIAVEVTNREREGVKTGGVTDGGRERSVSIAEKDRNVVGEIVDHREIAFAVAIEVADGNLKRLRSGSVADGSGERAVSVAQENRNEVRAGASATARSLMPSPLRSAAATDIRRRSGGIVHRGGERPVPVAQENGDVVRKRIGDREVVPGVGVEVGDRR